jgi:hypothetical protein
MTINIHTSPNHLHLSGDVVVGAYFGQVTSVIPIHLPGSSHPHVKASFTNGVSLDLSQATAIELTRRLQESLATMPTPLPDCSGSVWGGEV